MKEYIRFYNERRLQKN
ncbi:hypothetical protein D3Z33_06460 [Senegalia massiliensis]|uniref:Uncharacterized protein n=1 Tax=Senegalia massiliensis TaxID=1720316 RepID=A0A845QWY8_9CLOT|nr:hypothetical protein [Senegalia massiliensis]